jgi:N-acetylglucosamine kinase-like BadF-type ATPase
MKIFLGIDGGQTTTKSILADETGRFLGTGAGGPAIHLKDEETREHARRALYESIHAALREAGLPDLTEIESAFLGFTGVSGSETPPARTYCELTQEQFRIKSVAIDHDARSALAGAIPSMIGVIVIAGTGSIAFGMNASGESARAGGWGYLLGDQGSAYEIGRQALIAVGEAADGIGPKTVLTSLILEALKIPDTAAITQAIYRDRVPKLRMAAMSAVVTQAAEAGDEVARKIFLEGGKRLGANCGSAAVVLGRGGRVSSGRIALEALPRTCALAVSCGQGGVSGVSAARRSADSGFQRKQRAALGKLDGSFDSQLSRIEPIRLIYERWSTFSVQRPETKGEAGELAK